MNETSRSFRWWGLVGFVLSNVIVRLPALHQPLDRDMAAYATIGQQMGNGLVPYRDLFDHKQPLIYPVYWILTTISAHSTEVIRVGAALVAGLAAGSVFFFLSKHHDRWIAIAIASFVTVAGASTYVEGVDLNTEHLLILTGAVAVLAPFAFAGTDRKWFPFVAGALIGFALLSKASGIFIVPAAVIAFIGSRDPTQPRLPTIARFGLGAAVPPLVALGVFAYLGAVDELLHANITYNRAYVALAPHTSLGSWFDFPPLFLILCCLAVIATCVRVLSVKRFDVLSLTASMWLVGAAVGAQLSNRPFPHYYAPLIIPIAFCISLPFLHTAIRKRSLTIAGIVLLTATSIPFGSDLAEMIGKDPAALAERMYGSQAQIWAVQEDAGDFLRGRAQDGDRMMVAGAEPGFYWQSELQPATRYLYDYPMELEPGFATQVEHDLADPPRFLVLPSGQLPFYMATLKQHDYEPIRTFGPVQIFELSTP